MKRVIGLLLAMCLTAGLLCACGKKEPAVSSELPSAASPAPVASPEPSPVQMAKAVKVTAEDGLNIRSEPSTDCEILGLADYGDLLPLLVEKSSNGWYQVEYQGKTAYVSADYATSRDVTLEVYNQLKAGKQPSSSSSGSSSQAGDDDPGRPTAAPVSAATPTPQPSAAPTPDNGKEDGE